MLEGQLLEPWNVFNGDDFCELAGEERDRRIAIVDGTIECWRASADGAWPWDRAGE